MGVVTMHGGELSGTGRGQATREENSSRGWEKYKAREQGSGAFSLPEDTGVERREEGGHCYLVTQESHTTVLLSALERVGACIYQRDRGRCGNHTSGPRNPDVLYPEAIAE